MLECDYLIVGAGSAGCVLASRLSADPHTRVILIEAGRSDRDPLLHIPGASIRNSTTPRYNWSFSTEPVEGMADRRLFWAQGRAIGGSSSINGMIYARGEAADYDAWADAGCRGWSYNDVLPFFRKSEGNERGENQDHGGSGPLKVSRGRPTLPICDLFLQAAKADGFAIRDDFNTGSPEGFGHYDCTIDHGRRCSAATAFLKPARHRPNLKVLPHTYALHLTFQGMRATGADVMIRGRADTIRAARETVLCAGAVNSPQLLMLSGIGPADHLAALQIPVLMDAPDVGGNLQNHVAYRLSYACDEPITAYRYVNVRGASRAAFDYALFRRGVLADTIVPTGGFFRTDPTLPSTDVQVQLGVGLIGRVGKSVWARLPREHGFSLAINQGRPWSRGCVRLASKDPLAHPVIDPHYFSDRRDMDVLLAGVERVQSIVARSSLSKIVTKTIQPAQTGRAALEDSIRQNAGTAFHPVGTCRMGGDQQSVVDPNLRVRGIDNLRIADASIIPLLMNANTNAAAIMVGERASSLILEAA